MQNYRDPPPYPGHSKQVFTNQPGFRQSFSGSETSTDVSLSSTENLATSQRQEPQGEETQSLYNHLDLGGSDGSYSILARLGMPPMALDSSGKFSNGVLNPSSSSLLGSEKPAQKGETTSASSREGPGLASVQSPLYSHGHLTVPSWHLSTSPATRQAAFLHSSQHQFTERGVYAGEIPALISSRTPTLASTSSSSSSSTLTMISRGGLKATEFSSPASAGRPGEEDSFAGGSGSHYVSQPSFSCPSTSVSSSSSSSSQQYLSPRVPPVSTYHHPHPYVNTHFTIGSGDSTSSGSSLTALSHTAPSSQPSATPPSTTYHNPSLSYITNLPPPPEYPGVKGAAASLRDSSGLFEKSMDIRTSRSYEMMDKMEGQSSHPDLRLCASTPGIYFCDERSRGSANTSSDETDQAAIAAKASQMVDMLTEENRNLREELAVCAVKVAKLQKVEQEMHKVHESHEALLKSTQKREALWQAMKRKLEERIQDLETDGKPNAGCAGSVAAGSEAEVRKQLLEKDTIISRLVAQKQELSMSRDQLEGENTQLSLTVQEHRAHVDILENALMNTQSKVLMLEEEFRKKQVYMDQVEQLQGALASLQAASDRQKEKEKEMRGRLEKELEAYKAQEKAGSGKGADSEKEDVKSIGMLKKMLDEKDARILQLESEMAGLEQKYVKEATLRQLNREETTEAPNREVRLAALEKSSADMEKLIEEAKTEKLRHMEELHQSHCKMAELEARMKQLQTQLVEKEAMVKVFQRSPLTLARSSSHHALCHSPVHSPRPSLLSSQSWLSHSQTLDLPGGTSSSSYRELATIRHMKTGSASAIELGHKMSMEEDLLNKVQSLGADSKSDSEEEVNLWHV